jgi:hypothetical protein
MRAAGEIAFAAVDLCEPGRDALDMHRFARVRGASQRYVFVAEAECVRRTGFDERQCLQRLERGARKDGAIDIAPLRDDGARGIADGDGATVLALDDTAARQLN